MGILIECTNEIELSLPIMITIMVSKWRFGQSWVV